MLTPQGSSIVCTIANSPTTFLGVKGSHRALHDLIRAVGRLELILVAMLLFLGAGIGVRRGYLVDCARLLGIFLQ